MAITLNQNEIYSALSNMIISQQVFADRLNVDGGELVDMARIEAGLYGDTVQFFAADALHSYPWANDAEAVNLLDISRAAAPEVQAVTINKFRQICLTLDDYLSKRAWSTEGTFSSFNSLMESMLSKSKRIHDVTTYNTFFGTAQSSTGAQSQSVTVPAGSTAETEAKLIAEKIANIFVDLKDISRDFNDYGHVTQFNEQQIMVVFNSEKVNHIRKVDLPAIFHNEDLIKNLTKHVLPARYFGRPVAASDKGAGKVIDASDAYDSTKGTIRSLVEKTVTVSSVTYDLYPGDEIPSGATVKAVGDFTESEVYVVDSTIICKIVVKLPPFMSAFEVGTSFFNPRSLTTNRYITWGYNTLAYLKAYPMITLRQA